MLNINLIVNGRTHTCTIRATDRLIDVLREDLRLTSVKEGCSVGECGACTVIVDGLATCSCLMLAAQADGSEILTVEGLERNGELDDIQKAFIENDATQCGFCTPGMIMAVKALLMRNPQPAAEEIKIAIAGNICRCTGYIPIVNAVRQLTMGGRNEVL